APPPPSLVIRVALDLGNVLSHHQLDFRPGLGVDVVVAKGAAFTITISATLAQTMSTSDAILGLNRGAGVSKTSSNPSIFARTASSTIARRWLKSLVNVVVRLHSHQTRCESFYWWLRVSHCFEIRHEAGFTLVDVTNTAKKSR
ncbi:Hypothetical protein, putative, partial [Bodo saltans]